MKPIPEPRLKRLYEAAASAEINYSETGATRDLLPDGYAHDRTERVIGSGDDAFRRSSAALDTWGVHRGVGFAVYPSDTPVVPGTTVVVTVPLGPFRIPAPARVIYTVADDNRHGFCYGTLPGHPEIGEEYFGVRRQGEDVVGEIVAFSKPGWLLAKLGYPVTRWLQKRTALRYIGALEAAAKSKL